MSDFLSRLRGDKPGDEAEAKTTHIWDKYQSGIEQHRTVGLYSMTEKCHWMYEGDQWHGVSSGGEEFPTANFIKPVVKYKVANVAMNTTAIVFSPMDSDPVTIAVCDALNSMAESQWEALKMDSLKWKVVKNSAIEGDYYCYLFDATPRVEGSVVQPQRRLRVRLIPRTNVYLENEQEQNLEEQGWIILAERQPVEAVRRKARENKIEAEEIEQITSEEVDDTQINTGPEEEMKHGDGKCTVLLYMEKTAEGLQFCRSTRSVVFEPMKTVKGLDCYPVTRMVWEEKNGSARGIGCVEPMIPNQLVVNKNLARRDVVAKRLGFPNLVYDSVKVQNPEQLGKAGAMIEMQNLGQNPLASVIGYVTPPATNGEAANLQMELMNTTRELEGASSEATGQVDPTKTSGEAIKAARDQSAIPLTEQAAAYRQWVEDFARCLYKLWIAYLPGGMTVELPGGPMSGQPTTMLIEKEKLQAMELNIRIDISNTDPYSLLSREMALENALAQKHITFEEYVQAMDANAGVPKDKFEEILRLRREAGQALQAAGQSVTEMPAGMERLPQPMMPQEVLV